MRSHNFFCSINEVSKIITPIDGTIRFPELLEVLIEKYFPTIDLFCEIVRNSSSSFEILYKIRSNNYNSFQRMTLLKIYRRCVSPVLDTEATKKIRKISTESLIDTYGKTFKSIGLLKNQFFNPPLEERVALAALIGEYDTRGQLGYRLTEIFFRWFEERFTGIYSIEGPRGAGRDVELASVFYGFKGNFPCDFIIRNIISNNVLAIGFARYDSTRGGAQSDDRTSGNSNKVERIKAVSEIFPDNLKIIFLSDGPGLMHRDTWEETCNLDGQWNGRVRVTTLKLLERRITTEWLES